VTRTFFVAALPVYAPPLGSIIGNVVTHDVRQSA
jgi:hypothetical protein